MKNIFLTLLLARILSASTPEAVIFDFGGVVADVDRKPLLQFLSDSLDVPYAKIKKDFARDRLYQNLDKPLSFWELYAKRELSLSWKAGFEQKKREILHSIPGMDPLIEQLKTLGLKVVLLSNTPKARSLFLRNLGGYQPFQMVILSCDIGVAKPNPKIFEIALKKLKVDASSCLFIDDKKRNVDAAKKLGMDGIMFESPQKLIEELKKREIVLQ